MDNIPLDSELQSTGLDLFTKPEYCDNFANYQDVTIQPLHPPADSDHTTYSFTVGGLNDRLYTALNTIKIVGRLRVLHHDDTPLEKNELVSTNALFPSSIFEHCSVFLNSTPISDHGRGFPLKSYLNTNLSYQDSVKKTSLLADRFWSDSAGDSEIINKDELTDSFKSRMEYISESRDAFFCFQPQVDLLSTTKYLAPGIELRLEFEKGNHNFALLSPNLDKRYKIRVFDIVLQTRRFTPSTSICLANEKRMMAGSPIYYPINRTSIRYRQLHSGILSTTIPSLFSGQLPHHILICFLSNSQLSSLNHNPFIFHPHGLTKYSLIKNGATHPCQPISVGTDDGDFIRGYKFFLDNIGLGGANIDLGITPYDYLKKDFTLAFDLTCDSCMGAHGHRPESGVLDLKLEFLNPTPDPISLFILGESIHYIIIKY